jgi:hypothetical protein
MTAKRSKLLVVDACVALSAGETEHPMSRSCREALVSIREICHHIVMTEALLEQWHEHAQHFAIRWLAGMVARKKVHWCEGVRLSHVDEACEELSTTDQNRLREDVLLFEAACAADGIIVTRDDVIQKIWQKCRKRLRLPKQITWINPVTDGVQALEDL